MKTIDPELTEGLSSFFVVGADMLDEYTAGYRLIGTFISQETIDVQQRCSGGTEEKACQHGNRTDGCYNQVYSNPIIEVTKFIIGKQRDAVIAELQHQVTELNKGVREVAGERSALKKELKAVQYDADKYKRIAENNAKVCDEYKAERGVLKEADKRLKEQNEKLKEALVTGVIGKVESTNEDL